MISQQSLENSSLLSKQIMPGCSSIVDYRSRHWSGDEAIMKTVFSCVEKIYKTLSLNLLPIHRRNLFQQTCRENMCSEAGRRVTGRGGGFCLYLLEQQLSWQDWPSSDLCRQN